MSGAFAPVLANGPTDLTPSCVDARSFHVPLTSPAMFALNCIKNMGNFHRLWQCMSKRLSSNPAVVDDHTVFHASGPFLCIWSHFFAQPLTTRMSVVLKSSFEPVASSFSAHLTATVPAIGHASVSTQFAVDSRATPIGSTTSLRNFERELLSYVGDVMPLPQPAPSLPPISSSPAFLTGCSSFDAAKRGKPMSVARPETLELFGKFVQAQSTDMLAALSNANTDPKSGICISLRTLACACMYECDCICAHMCVDSICCYSVTQ